VLPPEESFLAADEVRVWQIELEATGDPLPALPNILSEDERARAARFHFDRDRRRFCMARVGLRRILGAYLGVAPEAVRFGYSSHGKPHLDPAIHGEALRFNLSHSGELALVALAYRREVGVDVEVIRPLPDREAIAERFFSPGEVRQLRALPDEQREEAFFACWTRKEALIKAHGGGLSLPLDDFQVSLAPAAPATPLPVLGAREELRRWSLRALSPAPGTIAAVAAEGYDWRLRMVSRVAG
jgi:4'-phosphopantetheinyl transferase